MSVDELELDAKIIDLLEEHGSFANVDDDELIELINEIKEVNGDDNEEAYEYLSQYGRLDEKRFLSLCE